MSLPSTVIANSNKTINLVVSSDHAHGGQKKMERE
jgi:hypothetical protein